MRSSVRISSCEVRGTQYLIEAGARLSEPGPRPRGGFGVYGELIHCAISPARTFMRSRATMRMVQWQLPRRRDAASRSQMPEIAAKAAPGVTAIGAAKGRCSAIWYFGLCVDTT